MCDAATCYPIALFIVAGGVGVVLLAYMVCDWFADRKREGMK